MASIQYVVNAVDAASGVFAKIAASADGLDKQLADLSKRVATPTVDLKDAKFTLGMINAAKRLDKLSAMVADPEVTLDTAKFQTEILRVNAQLDRLDARRVNAGGGRGRGGIGGLVGRAAGGALGGVAGSVGPGLGAAAIGPIAGLLGALAITAAQAAGALVAAGAGLASFGALAIPTVQKLVTNFSALQTAVINYGDASQNLDIAIHKSPANWKLYQATIHGLEPDLQNAARLLTNQNVLWQNLPPSMQKSVIALSNNKTALRALLPDQKTALTELLNQADAWGNLSPAQQTAAVSLQGLSREFHKLVDAMAPLTFKVLNEGLKVANNLLPTLLPFATTAGNALDGLVKSLAKFTAPAGGTDKLTGKLQAISGLKAPPTAFQQFLSQLQSLSGPAITALGNGLGQIAVAIGNLILAAAKPDSIRALGRILGLVAVTIDGVAWVITRASGNMQKWTDIAHQTASKFDEFRHDTARVFAAVATIFDITRHDIAAWADHIIGYFDNLRHRESASWDGMWSDTVGRTIRGIADVVGWFRKMPGQVVGAITGLGHTLGSFASAAMNEMWNGFKNVAGNIFGWFKGFGDTIISVVKKVLGVFSPSSVFFGIGKNLMEGLKAGVEHGASKAIAAAQMASHKVASAGAGVQRWAGLVRQALAMEGLSPGLLGNVLFQMSTESGGNVNAINLGDINARMGDPSRGLMQVIGSTFAAYHWPGTSNNIYDPLANIAAALNYARHVYGPTLMSGGMGIGSGHGYDSGGWLPPGASIAVNATGQPERVTSPAQETAMLARLDRIITLLGAVPGATGAAVGGALNGTARNSRSRAPR